MNKCDAHSLYIPSSLLVSVVAALHSQLSIAGYPTYVFILARD